MFKEKSGPQKFNPNKLWLKIVFALSVAFFLIIPLLNSVLNSRSVTETSNLRAQFVGTVLWGTLAISIAFFAILQIRKLQINSLNLIYFAVISFVEICLATILLTFKAHGALYWDSFSIIRLTAEGTIGDWRSFLFDSLVMYLMNIVDNIYVVPIAAVVLFCIVLNIPLLFSKSKKARVITAVISVTISLSSYFISNVSALFTDTFFASFTVLWTYSLLWLLKLLRSEKVNWRNWRTFVPEVPLFLLVAIPAVLLRHNGWVTGAVFLAGLVLISSKKFISIIIAIIAVIGIFSVGLLKNESIFPEAVPSSTHTNRNYQQIALVLNTWGALLNSPNGYNSPNLQEDLQQISLFVSPEKLKSVYTPITSIPAWEAFALPWREIDGHQTSDFMVRTIHRISENIPIFAADKTYFIFSMLTSSGTPEKFFEKECANNQESNCPIYGTDFQNHKYSEQVHEFTKEWPEQLNLLLANYLSVQFASWFVLASTGWFVFLIVRIKRSPWTLLIGITGLANIASLVLTIPSPEYRYFFSVVFLGISTLLIEINNMSDFSESNLETPKNLSSKAE